jgi:hypothetical protein
LSDILLGDNTKILNNLDSRPVQEFRGLYTGQNIMGCRIHGLVGDHVRFASILSELIKEDPSRKYVVLTSYNDATKGSLIRDLFADLISAGIIVGLFLNETPLIGNISYHQFSFLQDLGCNKVEDFYYFNSAGHKRKSGIPYLGFQNPLPKLDKVALFRFSGFHKHVSLRHIPEYEWLDLEKHLLSLNLDVHLYGHDDNMDTLVKPENDHRKKLSVLDTIKHMSDSGLLISTTTFAPLYMHFYIPCLVFIDPIDTHAINLMWRSNHNYMSINTQLPDHVEYVKEYVSRWYLANINVKNVLGEITQSLSEAVNKGV